MDPQAQKQQELQDLRMIIDKIDEQLLGILSDRFGATKRVGEIKKELGLPSFDPQREKEKLSKVAELASQKGLDPDFAQMLLKLVMYEVVKNHDAIKSL